MRIGVLVDQFPELSETFIAAELHALRSLGHELRVEAGMHAPRPHADAARGLDVAYGVDDVRAGRLRDLAWLVGRHPLGARGGGAAAAASRARGAASAWIRR
jgi:hypothetical protein